MRMYKDLPLLYLKPKIKDMIVWLLKLNGLLWRLRDQTAWLLKFTSRAEI